MRLLFVGLALVVMAPGLASAQTDPQAPAVPVQSQTIVVGEGQGDEAGRPDPDAEIICRVVQETGSRLARRRQRICGTRTMWDQLADENAHGVRQAGAAQAPGNENRPN